MNIVLYDLGKITDWLTALGTIGAVFVALYLSRQDRKPKANVSADIKYVEKFDGKVVPTFIRLVIVNTGLIPFTLASCTLVHHKQELGVGVGIGDSDYKMLKTGEHFAYNIDYKKISLSNPLDSKKRTRSYFYFEDTTGKKYKSNILKM